MQYLRLKLREGMNRIHREHPEVNFALDTPEIRAAEDALNEAGMCWYRFEAPLSEVQTYFKRYESVLLRANNL